MDKNTLKKRLLAAGISEDVIDRRLKELSTAVIKELGNDIPDAMLLKETKLDDIVDEEDDDEEEYDESTEKEVAVEWAVMRDEIVNETVERVKELLTDFQFEFDTEALEQFKETTALADFEERLKSLEDKIDLLLQADEDRLKEMQEGLSRQSNVRIKHYKTDTYQKTPDKTEEPRTLEHILKEAAAGNSGLVMDGDGNVYTSMSELITGVGG